MEREGQLGWPVVAWSCAIADLDRRARPVTIITFRIQLSMYAVVGSCSLLVIWKYELVGFTPTSHQDRQTVTEKFRLHGMRISNRNWHRHASSCFIIYLYTRKVHKRAHTVSLSTIHETSCLLWPFEQQYFLHETRTSCVPLDQQAYSELMRSGHRKHVSFGLEEAGNICIHQ
jgi:hypothetical protein